MKKFLAVGILAIGLIAMSQNQASAWVKWNIGVGANLGWSSGGNSLLWGAYRGAQPGEPDSYGHRGHQHHQGFYQAPHYTPYALEQSYVQPTYAAPSVSYAPYQYATNPRPVYYYYSTPYYYGR
ncbi:MAG: hypothetical protein EXR98_14410 [Gemmataceae bacterium]|nr:hypothetical protein [Gemmataceae bacterium]